MDRERAYTRLRKTDERMATARVEGEGQGGQTCGMKEREGRERVIEMKRERFFAFVAQATSAKFSSRSLEISGKRLVHSEYVYVHRCAIFIYPTHFSHPDTRSPLSSSSLLSSSLFEAALFRDFDDNFLHI